MTDHTTSPAPQDENQLMLERREKLKAIRQAQAEGKGVAFPNDFKPADHAADLFAPTPVKPRTACWSKAPRPRSPGA